MLELIFQGFMEWAYGLTLECWEYFSSSLLSIMSMDYAYMKSHVPVMVSITQVLLAVGWALLIGNLVFQALKSMAVGLGFEGEDPKLLFTRTFVFAFLLMASPQICEVGLSLTARIIELLEIPDAIDVTLVDEGAFGPLNAAWLLVIIFGLIIMFKVFRLLLEIAERYVILAVLTMTAPLAFAMGGSRSTSEIFGGWCRMFGSTYAMVVHSITDLNRLYAMYEQGDKSVYAVFSKERARDGYMRGPAVRWNRRRRAFLCPDCDAVIEMDISEDGISYTVPADQFFFRKENRANHVCSHCGTPLWSAVNPSKRTEWVKIGEYGWVHRYGAAAHLKRTKNEKVIDQLMKIAEDPDGYYPVRGAQRRYPLSTYIKKKLRGKISGFLCDELHEYNNASGQGDAMAELYGVSKLFVGMTATLINGYSSGIFHLLYRIVPGLMLKDDKRYRKPGDFDAEYGVVENTYEIEDAEYNSNRRANKRKTKSRLLPGVSPLVFSRFLLEYAAFLSLTDMNKDLPSYEEIPIALEMPENVRKAYEKAENILQKILRSGTGIAQKILSAYLNLLTVYPDQPYDQPEIVHPVDGSTLVEPENCGDFTTLLPKEEAILDLVQQKVEDGERVLIYTSWTRTDSQQKLLKLLRENGYRTEILTKQIPTEKREEWVDKRVKSGLQVLITNPRCVETGLDLNAFTTIIYYSMGYNLFTLRQASRRSWRINQTAPKVEVYMFYYANTMQAKAMKLMASKLAVAGIIEGTFSEEGLAAMSDVKDLTSQMAKELAAGIRDNVEDIAAAFKKMAIINPNRKKSVQEETDVEGLPAPEIVPEPHESSVRTAQTAAIWERYEGLLARTNEEKKKRKSKVAEVDENQLSIFDFAA